MKDYKSKINSYSTANGDKWRIEYAYKTPDGKYHRSCKRGFDSEDQAEKWRLRHLYKLIDEKETEVMRCVTWIILNLLTKNGIMKL